MKIEDIAKICHEANEEPIGNVIEALVRIYDEAGDDVIDNAFLNLGEAL